jgi:hypothetical protein
MWWWLLLGVVVVGGVGAIVLVMIGDVMRAADDAARPRDSRSRGTHP